MELSKKLEIDEDHWRYYLMRIRPETQDSSFQWEEFLNITRGELSFKIGNLVNRCMTMTYKYLKADENNMIELRYSLMDDDTKNKIKEIVAEYHKSFNDFKFRNALMCLGAISELGNAFIQKHNIWDVCSKNINDGTNFLGTTAYIISIMITLMTPFMPRKSEALSKNFIHNPVTLTCKLTNTNYNIPFKQMDYELIKELDNKCKESIKEEKKNKKNKKKNIQKSQSPSK